MLSFEPNRALVTTTRRFSVTALLFNKMRLGRRFTHLVIVLAVLFLCIVFFSLSRAANGLPTAPTSYNFSMSFGAITSSYGSMLDLDGSRRDIPHTGIDFGNFGV